MSSQKVLIAVVVIVLIFVAVGIGAGMRGGGQSVDIAQLQAWGESLFAQRVTAREISVSGGSAASCLGSGEFVIPANGSCNYEIAESSSRSRRLTLSVPEGAPFEIAVVLRQDKPEALTGRQTIPRGDRLSLTLSMFEGSAALNIACQAGVGGDPCRVAFQ